MKRTKRTYDTQTEYVIQALIDKRWVDEDTYTSLFEARYRLREWREYFDAPRYRLVKRMEEKEEE